MNVAPDEARRYIGASSIGKPCSREIWYGFHGVRGNLSSPELRRTFEIGKRLEGMVVDYIYKSDWTLERPSEKNNFLAVKDDEVSLFRGHMDGIIKKPMQAVLEIKTAKDSSYKRFVKHGLKVWSEVYYAQIQAYMGMSDIELGVVVALNKETSEIHHEWVKYDDVFYHELRMKALAISSVGEPPEKINKSPLYYLCNRCQFKVTCHGGE